MKIFLSVFVLVTVLFAGVAGADISTDTQLVSVTTNKKIESVEIFPDQKIIRIVVKKERVIGNNVLREYSKTKELIYRGAARYNYAAQGLGLDKQTIVNFIKNEL